VLRGFIHSTGIKDGAMQYVFDLVDEPGSVTRVVKVLREYEARVISVLTSFEDAADGMKRVAIRVMVKDDGAVDKLSQALKENFTVIFQGRDELKDLPQRKTA
jgi:acetoin utilization protein AcuB